MTRTEVVDDFTWCCLLMWRWQERINAFIMVHNSVHKTIRHHNLNTSDIWPNMIWPQNIRIIISNSTEKSDED